MVNREFLQCLKTYSHDYFVTGTVYFVYVLRMGLVLRLISPFSVLLALNIANVILDAMGDIVSVPFPRES